MPRSAGSESSLHLVLIKQLDQLGEIGQRAGEAVDLVDHHDGDLAGPGSAAASSQ
jgi:hypothetical protein